MIDFNKPHMVPQTTQSLLNTDQKDRQRQSKAYSRDVSNNKRQMDDIRHAQYRKQNTAVNKQKSHMQDNAAKASKRVTGSSSYYKEERTLQDFIDLCEGKQAKLRKERKEARRAANAAKRPRTKVVPDSLERKKEEAGSTADREFTSVGSRQQSGAQKTMARRADDYSAAEKSKAKDAADKQKADEKATTEKKAAEVDRKKRRIEYKTKKRDGKTRAQLLQKDKDVAADKAKKERETKAAKDAVRMNKQKEADKKEREEKTFTGRFGKRLRPGDRGARVADAVYDAPKNIAKGAGNLAKAAGKGILGAARAAQPKMASSSGGGDVATVDKVSN